MDRRTKIIAAIILTALVSGGCARRGPERAAVSGKITIDGELAESGAIRFVPAKGTSGPVGGAEIINGRYAIDADKGLLMGRYKVEIIINRKTGKKIPMPYPGGQEYVDEIRNVAPPKYNSASILLAEIKPGKNIADFELQSK